MGEREIPIEVIGTIDDDGDETENLKELADALNTHANSGLFIGQFSKPGFREITKWRHFASFSRNIIRI